MLSHIALAAGLLAVAADPAATPAYAPKALPPAYQQAQNYHNAGHPGVVEGCASCGGRYWHSCGPQSFRCHFLCSPCDMHQRMPYWNNERGYYYFRPYHVVHVVTHQEKTAALGRDPRNPYDNRFLDQIYDQWAEEEELRRKAGATEDLPQTPGATEPEEGTMQEEADPMPELQPTPETEPAPEDGSSRQGARALKKFVRVR